MQSRCSSPSRRSGFSPKADLDDRLARGHGRLLSATQDIALDAYRRELLSEPELGLGNRHVNAYRISGLVPGSLSLILADRMPWNVVFFITALFVLPGMVMTFW